MKRERESGSFATFTRKLEAYAHNRNSFHKLGFMENLAQSSLKATVKSVARWTWDRYTGSGRCHRGVMQLDKSLSLAERQRLAAVRTHDMRHKSTESRIRAARASLQQKGEALTQTAVGRIAGISRQTIATYRYVLDDVLKPVLRLATAKALNVKYGVYQVTAAPVQGVLRFGLSTEESEVLPIFDG